MEDIHREVLDNDHIISMQNMASLETVVYQQIPHIAINFDEFIHLRNQERVSKQMV